jgi:hypothetical protein
MGAEDSRGQLVKGLEVGSASFIAQFQSAEVAKPTECPLNDVAGLSQAPAVETSFAKRSQERFDPEPFDDFRESSRAVARVALQRLRLCARPSSSSSDGEHVDQQRQRNLIVAGIGGESSRLPGEPPRRRSIRAAYSRLSRGP